MLPFVAFRHAFLGIFSVNSQKIIIGNGITFNFSINQPCKVVYSIITDKNLDLVKLDNQLILLVKNNK